MTGPVNGPGRGWQRISNLWTGNPDKILKIHDFYGFWANFQDFYGFPQPAGERLAVGRIQPAQRAGQKALCRVNFRAGPRNGPGREEPGISKSWPGNLGKFPYFPPILGFSKSPASRWAAGGWGHQPSQRAGQETRYCGRFWAGSVNVLSRRGQGFQILRWKPKKTPKNFQFPLFLVFLKFLENLSQPLNGWRLRCISPRNGLTKKPFAV